MTEAKTGKEAREHIRAPIELKVEYKKMNTFFSDYTKNISKGGTFIKTGKPLPTGTRFAFKLALPQLSQPFDLLGEVVWARADGEEPGMGIRFIYRDDEQRRDFDAMVETLILENLGPVIFEKLLGKAPRQG